MTANILVVDDLEQNIRLMEAKLLSEYYTVYTATSGRQALEILKIKSIDVILLDCMMPEIDGFQICRIIKSDPELMNIPIIMVTALFDIEDRIRGLEVGADEFLTKPIDDLALFARIRSLFRVKSIIDELKLRNDTNIDLGVDGIDFYKGFTESKILVIDDDLIEAKNIASILMDFTNNIKTINSIEQLQSEVLSANFTPDITLIRAELDYADPLRIIAKLKSYENLRFSSLMMLIDEGNNKIIVKAMEMGISDYIIAPIDQSELKARAKTQLRKKYYQDALKHNLEKSMNLSIKDPLTGIYNRRYLESHMEKLLKQSINNNKHFYVMMIDVDNFKIINDKYGHIIGDEIIKFVSSTIINNVRAEDVVARYGGDEFVAIINDTSSSIETIAQRIITSIAKESVLIEKHHVVTASIGITQCNNCDSANAILTKADQALYEAKDQGRNRIAIKY
jgi:two-component system cell cycle response regulator